MSELIQFANKRPLIDIDRACFRKSPKEIGMIYTAKKELGKSKRHKFKTVLKIAFSLAFVALAHLAQAQVCRTPAPDHSRVIIGATDSLSTAVKAGLFNARFDVQRNEIAIIAGQPCIQAYYAVYDEDYRLITCGKVAKVKAGEYDIVKVGRLAEKCRVVFSVSPLFTSK